MKSPSEALAKQLEENDLMVVKYIQPTNLERLAKWCKENVQHWPRHTMGKRGKVGPLGWLVMQATDVEAKNVEGRPQPTPRELEAIEEYLGLSVELWSTPTKPHEKGVLTMLTDLADAKDVDGFIEALEALQ